MDIPSGTKKIVEDVVSNWDALQAAIRAAHGDPEYISTNTISSAIEALQKLAVQLQEGALQDSQKRSVRDVVSAMQDSSSLSTAAGAQQVLLSGILNKVQQLLKDEEGTKKVRKTEFDTLNRQG